nr:hypothetical protein GCM10020092_103890 [Actinoplanes digitatis]
MTSQFMRLVVRPARDVDRLIDGMMDYGRQFRSRSAYDDEPVEVGRRWASTVDEEPDNLIQYPSHRTTEYAARRAVNG